MDIRKTIVFIGNNENDRKHFETAITRSNQSYNFLALDHEEYSISRLKKSQPFWFHAIVIDLSSPSLWAMPFLRQISQIEHLSHVPVIAFVSNTSRSYLKMVEEAGADNCIFDLDPDGTLPGMFKAFENGQALSFVFNYSASGRTEAARAEMV